MQREVIKDEETTYFLLVRLRPPRNLRINPPKLTIPSNQAQTTKQRRTIHSSLGLGRFLMGPRLLQTAAASNQCLHVESWQAVACIVMHGLHQLGGGHRHTLSFITSPGVGFQVTTDPARTFPSASTSFLPPSQPFADTDCAYDPLEFVCCFVLTTVDSPPSGLGPAGWQLLYLRLSNALQRQEVISADPCPRI